MRKIGLEELKKIQLDILREVAKFCDKNDIRYYLCGGTLLGAIRHKGYIPWDDDIDIAIPRKDYEKFIKLFNDENRNLYVISCEVNNKYPSVFAKVYNTKIILVEYTNMPYENHCVNIDIFPIDNMSDNIKLYKRQYQMIQFYRNICILKAIKSKKGRIFYKEIILFLGRNIFKFISFNKLARKINQIAQKYNSDETDFVARTGSQYKMRLPRSIFDEQIEVEFEKEHFKAPVGYHEYLTILYGDYMKLPPIDKQKTHHNFEAYWKDDN